MTSDKTRRRVHAIHPDFLLAQQRLYEPNGLAVTRVQLEKESREYGALDFHLNDHPCKFRVAKITPKKLGFFVTIWKRSEKGCIAPFDLTDPIDFYIFSIRSGEKFGQFCFPKAICAERKIIASSHAEGKRATRLYPPWIVPESRQARDSQAWQKDYFLDASDSLSIDIPLVGHLLRGAP